MRAYKDLREFLGVLDQNRQLLRVTEMVKPEPDLGAAACALAQRGLGNPAVLFNNIAGYTNAQVVMSAHGSWPNLALGLDLPMDMSPKDQFFAFAERYQKYPGTLERAPQAPWQEVVIDKDIDLYQLMPLFRLNRGDGG